MGNSKTSRYADGKTIHDLNHATAAWLRSLVEQSRLELVTAESMGPLGRRGPPKRLASLRDAILRAPPPQPVSLRRGAGEVQRMLLDPDIAPRLRKLARKRRQDEGDVASVWARVRVHAQGMSTTGLSEASGA